MSNITCILDACSIINLVAIDEDDFLIKRLFKHLNLSVCEKVIKEVKCNIFKKEKLENRRKEVNQLIGQLYRYIVPNSTVERDCGKDFYDKVHEISTYEKENGEFYSSALALYTSQCEETKLFFHTDDSPAKSEFQDFFTTHQIGSIEDTSDLILLLYRLDDKFTNKELIKFLDLLFAEYAQDVALCLKEFREISSSINQDRKYRKKGNVKCLVDEITRKLNSHDFSGINTLKQKLLNVVNSKLKHLIQKHETVFMLDSTSYGKNDFLNKIRTLQKRAKEERIHRIMN